MTAEPTSDPAAALLTLSAVQALAAGTFPDWWVAFWMRNGRAELYGADRAWLEDNGMRLQEALSGDRKTRDGRLWDMRRHLATEVWFGPRREAAAFFLQFIAELHEAKLALEQAYAEITSRDLVLDEGRGLADILATISDHTATVTLVERLAEAPTRH